MYAYKRIKQVAMVDTVFGHYTNHSSLIPAVDKKILSLYATLHSQGDGKSENGIPV